MIKNMTDSPEHHSPRTPHEIKLNRLESLVDGVFAFAMTLLVLNLVITRGLPVAELDTTLRGLLGDILIYFLSFMILGNFWTIINWQSTHIERSDTLHLWTVIIMLMFVALSPFSTFLLAEYDTTVAANVFFAADFTLIGLFLAANWFYATAHHRLVSPNLGHTTILRGRRRSLALALVGAVVGIVSLFAPLWSALIYLAIPLLYVMPQLSQRD
jgi:TMEM175 potassium channel family protein